jgi:hypothetical protein
VLLLEVSTLQGRELHLDVFRIQTVLPLDLSTLKACAATGLVYTLGPELLLDVPNPRGPLCIIYLFALLSRPTQFAPAFLKNVQVASLR